MYIRPTAIIIAMLLISSAAFAQENERITLSTYYPAPYGEYESLSVDNPSTAENFTTAEPGYMVVENRVGIAVDEPLFPLDIRGRWAMRMAGAQSTGMYLAYDTDQANPDAGDQIRAFIGLNNTGNQLSLFGYDPAHTNGMNPGVSDIGSGWGFNMDVDDGDIVIGGVPLVSSGGTRKLTIYDTNSTGGRSGNQLVLMQTKPGDSFMQLGCTGNGNDTHQSDEHGQIQCSYFNLAGTASGYSDLYIQPEGGNTYIANTPEDNTQTVVRIGVPEGHSNRKLSVGSQSNESSIQLCLFQSSVLDGYLEMGASDGTTANTHDNSEYAHMQGYWWNYAASPATGGPIPLLLQHVGGNVGIGFPDSEVGVVNMFGSLSIKGASTNRQLVIVKDTYLRGYLEIGIEGVGPNEFGRIQAFSNNFGARDLYLNADGGDVYVGTKKISDYVFEPAYKLESIQDHAKLMWDNKHLPKINSYIKNKEGKYMVNLTSINSELLEELEIAHIYIEQLDKRLKELEKKMAQLEKR